MDQDNSMDVEKECPLGIEGRFCEHQETTTKDTLSAVRGELTFICKLNGELKDCPLLKEMMDETLK